MNAPTRPVLRWHGGKWKLAPWIISHFPKHRVYVEPFGGAASVLLRKAPVYCEVYNDLDEDVVNLFRVLRDPDAAGRLIELLDLTPFSRREFESAYDTAGDTTERARRLIVRSFMGFGSDAPNVRTGFRAQSPQSGRSPEKDWLNYPAALRLTIARLRETVIECRPADDVMRRNDADWTLHYVDPPYMPDTRSTKMAKGERYHAYAHELDHAGHKALLETLRDLRGMVALSGYPSALYDRALTGWQRIETDALADGARPRTEVLWLNPSCSEALKGERARADMPLFVLRDASQEVPVS